MAGLWFLKRPVERLGRLSAAMAALFTWPEKSDRGKLIGGSVCHSCHLQHPDHRKDLKNRSPKADSFKVLLRSIRSQIRGSAF